MIFLVRPLTGELEQDEALPAYADATYALNPTNNSATDSAALVYAIYRWRAKPRVPGSR